MMMKKIFNILISLLVLGGCASGTTCISIRDKAKKIQCEEADRKWYNENGWRYDRPERDNF